MVMAKPRCVMAAKCARCGEEFDIGYDLKRGDYELMEKKKGREREGMLCWECREN